MEITKQKKFYLYRQTIRIGEYHGCYYDHQIRYILSETPLKEESMYDIMKAQNIKDYDTFFKMFWTPCFNLEGASYDMEYVSYDSGWSGLYAILPQLNSGRQVCEMIITVKYNYPNNHEKSHTIKPLKNINYMAERDFSAVLISYDHLMLGIGNDAPFYEFENGHIKWDVHNREDAFLSTYKPICDLFVTNEFDEHGVQIPYKCTVKIEGNIYKNY